MMVGAYRMQPILILPPGHISELRHVCGAALGRLEVESVGHADIIDGGGEKFRMLGDDATYGDTPRARAS